MNPATPVTKVFTTEVLSLPANGSKVPANGSKVAPS